MLKRPPCYQLGNSLGREFASSADGSVDGDHCTDALPELGGRAALRPTTTK